MSFVHIPSVQQMEISVIRPKPASRVCSRRIQQLAFAQYFPKERIKLPNGLGTITSQGTLEK
jgi:hypothetical protein